MGVSPTMVWKWLREGQLAARKVNRIRLIRRVDLEAFIDAMAGIPGRPEVRMRTLPAPRPGRGGSDLRPAVRRRSISARDRLGHGLARPLHRFRHPFQRTSRDITSPETADRPAARCSGAAQWS